MKKKVMTMLVALLISGVSMAQDQEHKRPSKAEMIQYRTERMSKHYGLNEDQKAKLLELNTQYADQLVPPGGHRFHEAHKKDQKPMHHPDSVKPRERKHRRMDPVKMEEMKKFMQEYENKLQSILTENQFKSYQADKEKRMNHQPRK